MGSVHQRMDWLYRILGSRIYISFVKKNAKILRGPLSSYFGEIFNITFNSLSFTKKRINFDPNFYGTITEEKNR
jgi:hypothetical protein